MLVQNILTVLVGVHKIDERVYMHAYAYIFREGSTETVAIDLDSWIGLKEI